MGRRHGDADGKAVCIGAGWDVVAW
jgi:hypothetical protein